MKIVVNHLTRMAPGYICAAGIDQSTGKPVRPVLLGTRLTRSLLKSEGGLFGIGAVVDLGEVKHNGSPPEVEDHIFDPARAKRTSTLKPAFFWKLLELASSPNLATIFGARLTPNGSSMSVDLGEGTASLGCVVPSLNVSIEVDGRYDSVKLHFEDDQKDLLVGVTDLRLFEKDQKTPKRKVIDDINRRLRDGVACILSVGLSRAFVKQNDTKKRHYLQVNNLHFEDDPCWSG